MNENTKGHARFPTFIKSFFKRMGGKNLVIYLDFPSLTLQNERKKLHNIREKTPSPPKLNPVKKTGTRKGIFFKLITSFPLISVTANRILAALKKESLAKLSTQPKESDPLV